MNALAGSAGDRDARVARVGWRLRAALRAAEGLNAFVRTGRRVRHRLLRRPGAPPLRILLARRARLGDLVASLPLLDALRARHPDARIEIGGAPAELARALAVGGGRADTLHAFDTAPQRSRLRQLRDALLLAGRGYDVLLTGERFALLRDAYLCGAPVRVGFDDGHPLRALCSHRVPFDAQRHAADNLRALCAALGHAPGEDAPRLLAPRIPAAAVATPEARRALRQKLGVPAGACLIAVHPGAQKPSRRWPAERFAELAERLLARDPQRIVLLTGGPEEQALASEVERAVPRRLRHRVRLAAGSTRLPELLALLADARLAICNDTGVLHVARALGTPLLALLGPENDRVWGPHPAGEGAATSLRHHVPCAPCKRFTCDRLFCLRSLTVEEAQREAERLLAGRTAPGLRRVETLHDWRALASAGFALPEVAIVGSTLCASGAEPPGESEGYPAVRRIAGDEPSAGDGPHTQTSDARHDPALAAASAAADPAGGRAPGDLGEAVALLQRDPRLTSVRLAPARPLPPGAPAEAVLHRNLKGRLELRAHG